MYRQECKSGRSDKLEILKALNVPFNGKFHFEKKGLQSPGGQQVEHKPAMCLCGKGGQQHPELH